MTLPDRQKVEGSSDTCTRQPIESTVLPTETRLPDRSEHWNYLTSVSASPDGKLVLVGSEAGSSTSHFEDYWLFDRASNTWRYAGGGNEAKWSPTVPQSYGPLRESWHQSEGFTYGWRI